MITGAQIKRSRKALIGTVLLVAFVLGLVACGGGSSSNPGPGAPSGPAAPATATSTPAGTYTIVLNATSGSRTESVDLKLTVQ